MKEEKKKIKARNVKNVRLSVRKIAGEAKKKKKIVTATLSKRGTVNLLHNAGFLIKCAKECKRRVSLLEKTEHRQVEKGFSL